MGDFPAKTRVFGTQGLQLYIKTFISLMVGKIFSKPVLDFELIWFIIYKEKCASADYSRYISHDCFVRYDKSFI